MFPDFHRHQDIPVPLCHLVAHTPLPSLQLQGTPQEDTAPRLNMGPILSHQMVRDLQLQLGRLGTI